MVRPHMPESLWSRIADLPLAIESHALERLEAPAPAERVTIQVRLRGGGVDGLGEDVGGTMLEDDDGAAFAAAAPSLPLAGEWTLAGFVDHLAGADLWPGPPGWGVGRGLRNWAVQSRAPGPRVGQAGARLAGGPGRSTAPVR